jgi:flagellar protein FlaG
MLSDIQGGSRPIHANTQPQMRTPAPVQDTPAPVKDVSIALPDAPEVKTPKVVAPKPVEIKVDLEKMKANLQESLQKLNETMRDGGRSLNFQMDEQRGGLVVQVKNADTGEVVRQIPSDVVVRIASNIEAFKGLLHNELT